MTIYLKCPNCNRDVSRAWGDISLTIRGRVTVTPGPEGVILGVIPGTGEVTPQPKLSAPGSLLCPHCNSNVAMGEWGHVVLCGSCSDIIDHHHCSFCKKRDTADTVIRNHYCHDLHGCLCTHHAEETTGVYCNECGFVDECNLVDHINWR